MSFNAYIENVKIKTGKGPDDFKKLAVEKSFMENGIVKKEIKASEVLDWLKKDFDLGHGHAMAIYAMLKGKKE